MDVLVLKPKRKRTVIDEAMVEDIWKYFKKTYATQKEIGVKFNLNPGTISAILTRKMIRK